MKKIHIEKEVIEKLHSSVLMKIERLLMDKLLYKDIKPRKKWQEPVGWNGTEFMLSLREYNGTIILIMATPIKGKARRYVKSKI